MNKSKHLTFRCTDKEYKLIKQYGGKNVSKYIVSRLFYAIRKLDFEKQTEPKT